MERRDLNRMFDALAPTQEQEQAGLDRLLQKERKCRPMKKLKKLTIIGIAAALMVISCAAAVVTGLDQRLIEYFGAGAGEEKQLSGAIVTAEPVIHSYESGWTVRVGQVLADRYTVTVVLDFTAPADLDLPALVAENGEFDLLVDYRVEDGQGNLLGTRYYFPDGPRFIGAGDERAFDSYEKLSCGYGLGRNSIQILEDSQLDQGRISALWTYYNSGLVEASGMLMSMTEDGMLGARLRLAPKALRFQDTEKALYIRGEDQAWTYQITLPETDSGRLYIVDQPIRIESTQQELKRIYLSPMELAYDTYYYRGQRELYAFPRSAEDYTINLLDGSVISMEEGVGMTGFHNEKENGDNWEINHIRVRPAELVDLEKVASVTLFGQTFELN